MRHLPVLLASLLIAVGAAAQPSPAYKNPALSVEDRVDDLLDRMTVEEKFRQLFMIPVGPDAEGFLSDDPAERQRMSERYSQGIFGFQFGAVPSVGDATRSPGQHARLATERINAAQRFFIEESRLGIPILPFDEALHGLVREGATAFPQAIALAATFDTVLVGRVAGAIADETRSRGIRQILSPVLNISRDPRWGRTEETYGEDSFLTSAMGRAFIGAIERSGVVATPKHFVANVGEGGRDSYPIEFSERLLEEVYFPAFRTAIQSAGARSLMAAYNSVDGAPASASTWLLTTKLKTEWGFDGFVISDAGGTGGANVLHFTAADYADATARAINSGLDAIFQTSFDHVPLFQEAFDRGMIDPAVMDSAVARVLRVKFELGLFDDPYADPGEAARLNGSDAHRRLAREAARASLVLLKNDRNVLPLTIAGEGATTSIAVIGPDALDARLGGYSGPGNNVVNILDGIRSRAGEAATVTYAPGVPRQVSEVATIPSEYLNTVTGARGLDAAYWDNPRMEGEPTLERVDARVDFAWTLFGPDQAIDFDWYSVRWTGRLKAPVTGRVTIGVEGNDGYRLWVGDSLLIDNWRKRSFDRRLATVDMEAGRSYPIRLEYHETVGSARMRLVWDHGVEDDSAKRIAEAADVAKSSDVAVVVAGIEEGEFRDRSSLVLPGRQAELIRAVTRTGTPTVVVLIGGSAVTMEDFLDDVDAVLLAWYPGEAGGEALADVLFGDVSPGGRLPITFPRSEGQLPLYYAHKPTGRSDDYADGSGRPLFPFGFGLSYSSFSCENLRIEPAEISATGAATISFTLTNSGSLIADEVVQLYIRDEIASVAQPVRKLVDFQRLELAPGASREVSFRIGPEELSMLDADLRRVVEPGRFRVMVGSSSEDIRLRDFLSVIK